MCRHSTLETHGIGAVSALAQIGSKGLDSYVKLATEIRFTIAAAPAWLLVHSESGKPQGFSRLRHASSYQIRSQEKAKKHKKRCNSIRLGHITEKFT